MSTPSLRPRVSFSPSRVGFRPIRVLAILVAFALGARSFVGALPAAVEAVGHADPGWLAAAVGAEVVSYCLIALVFQRTAGAGSGVGGWLAMRTAVVAFGLGNILPGSPAPGITLATVALRRRGVPVRRVGIAMGWTTWFMARAFLGLAATAAIVAAAQGHVPERHEALVLGVASFVLATLLLTVTLFSHSRPLEWAAVLLARLRWHWTPERQEARAAGQAWHSEALGVLGTRTNREVAAACAVGIWLADAFCLQFALLAVGYPLPVDVLLLIYAFAIALSCVPFVPGGAGVVEAAVPALLHRYGLPLEAAIASVLAWRACALLLPAAVGAALELWSRAPVPLPGLRRLSH